MPASGSHQYWQFVSMFSQKLHPLRRDEKELRQRVAEMRMPAALFPASPKKNSPPAENMGWQAACNTNTAEQPVRRCSMKALTPWRPMRELETIRQRMDDLFERMSERVFGPGQRERSVWGETEALAPAIESHVDKDTLIIKADLPGIDPKEVSISVTGNQLTIEGERKQEEKKEEKDYVYREVAYGKFSRTMTLPEGVDADKVKANYKNGVLEITMPAPKQIAGKKIQIEAQK
jgi:HSP20 family protein